MKSIKNLVNVVMMAYAFHKDGADIKVNLKNRTIDCIGYGYNETLEF